MAAARRRSGPRLTKRPNHASRLSLNSPAATGICRPVGLVARQPIQTQRGRISMLRSIDHFIGGSTFASGERQGEVFDPNQGEVQAQVRLGTAADLERAGAAPRGAQAGWAGTKP